MSLLYCYGIVEKPITLEKKGFGEGKVYTVSFKDILAVVSDVPAEQFSQEIIDEKVQDLKWLAEQGQKHETVVEAVMQKTTTIPLKFCTIFNTKEKVRGMLEEKYADFKYNLNKVKDTVELGLKVYYQAEPIRQRIIQASPEIKALEQEAAKKKPGAAYFDQQKIELLVKEKIQVSMAEQRKAIFTQLKNLASESLQKDILDKKITKKDMLLNAVFLIPQKEKEQFESEINSLKAKNKDLQFELWGPFPPYNFVK